MGDAPCQSTPADVLRHRVMDVCTPKNESEWWAHHEIKRLVAEVERLRARNAKLVDLLRRGLEIVKDYASWFTIWIDDAADAIDPPKPPSKSGAAP